MLKGTKEEINNYFALTDINNSWNVEMPAAYYCIFGTRK